MKLRSLDNGSEDELEILDQKNQVVNCEYS